MGRPPSPTPAQQKEATRRRAQSAKLHELADSCDRSISTMRRAPRRLNHILVAIGSRRKPDVGNIAPRSVDLTTGDRLPSAMCQLAESRGSFHGDFATLSGMALMRLNSRAVKAAELLHVEKRPCGLPFRHRS
jgi:hypothetical protein